MKVRVSGNTYRAVARNGRPTDESSAAYAGEHIGQTTFGRNATPAPGSVAAPFLNRVFISVPHRARDSQGSGTPRSARTLRTALSGCEAHSSSVEECESSDRYREFLREHVRERRRGDSHG